MIKGRTTLAIILARGGSKGIPRKNIVKLHGKPLLAYTIEAALRAKSLHRVVLSTEDEEIGKIAEECRGVEVIMRPAEYATDTASIELALKHGVSEIEQQGVNTDIVVVLYANVPIRKEGIIDRVVEKLITTGADSVQTYTAYTTPPQWAYSIAGDKPTLLDKNYESAYRRQLLVPAYYPDGAVLALRRDTLMQVKKPSNVNDFMGTDRRAIIQSPRDTVDVDEPVDLLWAEFLLERVKSKSKRGVK